MEYLKHRKDLIHAITISNSHRSVQQYLKDYPALSPDDPIVGIIPDLLLMEHYSVKSFFMALDRAPSNATLRAIIQSSDKYCVFEYSDGETYQYAGFHEDKHLFKHFTRPGLVELDLDIVVTRIF